VKTRWDREAVVVPATASVATAVTSKISAVVSVRLRSATSTSPCLTRPGAAASATVVNPVTLAVVMYCGRAWRTPRALH
jgi:hypothetical protein